jgi:hypothetical protein
MAATETTLTVRAGAMATSAKDLRPLAHPIRTPGAKMIANAATSRGSVDHQDTENLPKKEPADIGNFE